MAPPPKSEIDRTWSPEDDCALNIAALEHHRIGASFLQSKTLSAAQIKQSFPQFAKFSTDFFNTKLKAWKTQQNAHDQQSSLQRALCGTASNSNSHAIAPVNPPTSSFTESAVENRSARRNNRMPSPTKSRTSSKRRQRSDSPTPKSRKRHAKSLLETSSDFDGGSSSSSDDSSEDSSRPSTPRRGSSSDFSIPLNCVYKVLTRKGLRKEYVVLFRPLTGFLPVARVHDKNCIRITCTSKLTTKTKNPWNVNAETDSDIIKMINSAVEKQVGQTYTVNIKVPTKIVGDLAPKAFSDDYGLYGFKFRALQRMT
ncbi:hypothetical protein DFJ73DRAFT_956867 [Zopfochytrium polystomum]|nr:hypothetical protein DFJ73DRAFT_956867 [Zopfochytrium polystomum]